MRMRSGVAWGAAICLGWVLQTTQVWAQIGVDPGDLNTAQASATPRQKQKKLQATSTVTSQYYTNPGRKNSASKPSADASVQAQAGIAYRSPGKNTEFGLELDAGWEQYFGLNNEATLNLSGPRGKAETAVLFNKAKQVSVRWYLEANHSTEPATASESRTMPLTRGESGLEFRVAPGGGAFVTNLGYVYAMDYYHDGAPNAEQLRQTDHIAQLRSKWLFLPKTSIFLNGHFVFSDFLDNTSQATDDEGNAVLPPNADGFVTGGHMGLAGRLGSKLQAKLKGGYSYSAISSRGSPTGELSIDYLATELMKIGFSVDASIRAEPVFGDVSTIRAKVNYKQQFGRVEASLNASASTMSFSGVTRSDQLIGAFASIRWHFMNRFAIEVSERFTTRTSDYLSGALNPSYSYNQTALTIVGNF